MTRPLPTIALFAAGLVLADCANENPPTVYHETFAVPSVHSDVSVYLRGDDIVQLVYFRGTLVEVDFGSMRTASTAELDPLEWSEIAQSVRRPSNADVAAIEYSKIKQLGCLYARVRPMTDVFSRGAEWRRLRDTTGRCLFMIATDPASGGFESIERTDIPHEVQVNVP